jgi:hypothetical protein
MSRWVRWRSSIARRSLRAYSPVFPTLFLAWFVAVVTVWLLAVLVDGLVPPAHGGDIPRAPVEVLSTWDGRWYANIATTGYSVEGQNIRRFAFFPLFPAIARMLGGSSHAVLAGILFNQLCLLASLLLINRLAEVRENAALREQPGFWLLISPASFFFHVFYTESLFLLLTLLMVAASRGRRFGPAALCGFMTGLTRPTAVCVPVIFVWWAMNSLRERRRLFGLLLCAAAPLVGMASYFGVVGYLLGDPFGYIDIQRQWWESRWTLPFASVLREFSGAFIVLAQGGLPPLGWMLWPLSSFGILILLFWGWRKCDPAFGAYVIVSMLFIHSQEPSRSTLRYELVLFPVFLLAARLMARHPRLARIVSAVLAGVQLTLFVWHISYRWVA